MLSIYLGDSGDEARTRSSARHSWNYIFTFFSFYWGQIFTIVFHFSPRNEYFCSPGVYGLCGKPIGSMRVWNENQWRTSKIDYEEKEREDIKQHRGKLGACTKTAVFSLRISFRKKRTGGLDVSPTCQICGRHSWLYNIVAMLHSLNDLSKLLLLS